MLELKHHDGLRLKGLMLSLLKIDGGGTAIITKNGISLKGSHEDVIAVLKIDSGDIGLYRCSDQDSLFISEVGFAQLHDVLSTISNTESVTLWAYFPQSLFRFAFSDLETGRSREHQCHGPAVSRLGNKIDESNYEYDVVAGIPSKEFRRVMKHFTDFGAPFVEAFITEDEVTFTFGDEDIVLKSENGECLIGYMGESIIREIHRIYLSCSDAYMEALNFCKAVWLCKSTTDNGSPDLVNFPIKTVGNLMFYKNGL